MGFSPFDEFMFTAGPIIFVVVFVGIIGAIIFAVVKSIGQWSSNNNSPRLSVPAHIITKRTDTRGGSGDTSAHTDYYVTFQVESGDRMEFEMSGKEYGMLAEQDIGILSFQGTRYLDFERKS